MLIVFIERVRDPQNMKEQKQNHSGEVETDTPAVSLPIRPAIGNL